MCYSSHDLICRDRGNASASPMIFFHRGNAFLFDTIITLRGEIFDRGMISHMAEGIHGNTCGIHSCQERENPE